MYDMKEEFEESFDVLPKATPVIQTVTAYAARFLAIP